MRTAGIQKNLDIGADVIGRDGKKLGTVAYVVVQPPDMHLTHFVVRTGAVLGRDIVVPIDVIRDVNDGRVYLSIDKDDLEQYPDYVELDYRQPPDDWIPPLDFYYPPVAVLIPPSDLIPAATVRVNAPPGTRDIHESMEVETRDGHKVGSVDALDVDLTDGAITGFVVKKGLLFARDIRIPVEDVQEIRDDKVILKLTKDQIQQMEQERRQHTV